MGGCGRPAGGGGLGGLRAAGTKVFLHLPGFWSPVGTPEAALLLEKVGTPAGQKEDVLIKHSLARRQLTGSRHVMSVETIMDTADASTVVKGVQDTGGPGHGGGPKFKAD